MYAFGLYDTWQRVLKPQHMRIELTVKSPNLRETLPCHRFLGKLVCLPPEELQEAEVPARG